jgi:hypothetical protein
MTFLWIITGASLIAALVAWRQARRTAKRLEQLSEMYWELKFQHGELRVQMQRMSGDAPPSPAPLPAGQPAEAFVPLASLKR